MAKATNGVPWGGSPPHFPEARAGQWARSRAVRLVGDIIIIIIIIFELGGCELR